MIINNEQLKQTREQLARLEEDLFSMQKEILPVNPERFYLLAEAYVDHIAELRGQIDEYIGIKACQDEFEGLWMRLIGPSIQLGTASASLLVNTVENFRKSIRSIAAILSGELPRKGRISKSIERSCDLVIVGLKQGSMKVGLGLPPERQADFLKSAELPAVKAIDIFMEVSSWASSLEEEPVVPLSIENLPYKDFILRQVLNMTPSKNMPIEVIEFSGKLVHMPKTPQLSIGSRIRLQRVIVQKPESQGMEAVGVIREIDLDSLRFYLRERPNNELQLHCEVAEDMIDEVKAALGEKVKLSGIVDRDIKGKIKILKVKIFELISEEEAG